MIASRAVAVRLGAEAGRGPRNLSNALLLLWAYREITDGTNWFRRVLGAGAAGYGVWELGTRW